MKKLRFICAQPATIYYVWQVEVMLNNFMQMGINPNDVDIVCWKENGVISEEWSKLANGYAARFFFYDDTRETKHYISSIRPNILKQHFKEFPDLNQRAIFYHDCDIVITKFPDFLEEYTEDDNNWYISDTISYIGHDYIVSKGEEVLDRMCDIVGINKKLVKSKQSESGGAQYILKGVDWQFFEKMEADCENLFREITFYNRFRKQKEPNYHELQIWCADMWAMLWGGWMRGYNSIIIPEMDFCWATDDVSKWEERYIFHNAGVVDGQKDALFYKGDFTNALPYNSDLDKYLNTKASWKYVQIIKETKENTCL
jgi:hypothetical protein